MSKSSQADRTGQCAGEGEWNKNIAKCVKK